MPQKLYAKEVMDAKIDSSVSGNSNGFRLTFKSADGVTTFGYIEDNANTYTNSNSLADPVALRVDLTLNADASFAIPEFYMVEVYIDLGSGNSTVIKAWFEALSSSSPATYYIDVDGNTYDDAALTTAAGGVALVSDSLTPTDAESNEAFEASLADVLNIEELLSDSEYNPDENYNDFMWINDVISSALSAAPILSVSDFIEVSDHLIAYLGTDIWTEEG